MQTSKSLLEKEDLRTTLAEILHGNSAKWMRISRAILRNKEDAEDVLNEAVQRVLKRGASFSSREHMRLYMNRTVGNTAVELYKRRQRERRQYAPVPENITQNASAEQLGFFRPDLIMEEEERYADRENRLNIMRRGLEELPVNQYEAIRLTALSDSGMTFRKAESVSGIPSTTLRYRYHKGMQALRKYIKRELRKR